MFRRVLLFNNLGLALGMAFKFYISMTKELELKVEKFSRLIPMFVGATWEELVMGIFLLPTSPVLNRVKSRER